MGIVSFSSHRVEQLYEYFKAMLFNEYTNLFTRRIVVVPSPLVRSWLEIRLSQDPDINISTGIEWYLLASFVDQFPRVLGVSIDKRIPRYLELCLRIEEVLRKESFPDNLEAYLGRGYLDSFWGKEQRITHLADYLARLFTLYGQYPTGVVTEGKVLGWQGDIWKKVYRDDRLWESAFVEQVSKKIFLAKNIFIHLFPVSYLSRIQHEVLNLFSEHYPVYYYQFAPSFYYWGDVRSVRERIKDKDESEENVNPLLASWGKLGRAFLRLSSENVTCVEADSELYSSKETLLSHCHEDILSIEKGEGLDIKEVFPSIQLHSVSSKRREVQVVFDLIKRLIDEKGYLPEDFLILSPDIQEYVSLIDVIVGEDLNSVPYQVLDLGKAQENLCAQGVLNLLELSKSRWDLSSVLKLFNNQKFRKWVRSLNITWGMNEHHRGECFVKDYGVDVKSLGEEQWSWEFGFKHLLEAGEEGKEWVTLLRSLFKDLTPLRKNEEKTLGEWVGYIRELFIKYFDEFNDSEDFEEVEKAFCDFSSSFEYIKEHRFLFSTFEYHLNSFFSKDLTNISTYLPGYLHFCSMFPMRSIPAKIVIVMGMDESAFPRKEYYFSMNLLKEAESKEYVPTQQEYDRYLFLETLLSARDYLFFTQTISFKGGKCYATPSFVIQELFNYLDSTYSLNGEKPSDSITFTHPSQEYSACYFKEESSLKSYSKRGYKLACTFFENKQSVSDCWKPMGIERVKEESVFHYTIFDLVQVIKSPIKVYCNYALNMWKERLKSELNLFSFTYKELWLLRKELFLFSPEELVIRWKKRGHWPIGALGESAWESVLQHNKEIDEGLESLGVRKGELKKLVLSDSFKESRMIDEKTVGYPAIWVDKQCIQGSIGWICSKGLLVDKKNEQRQQLLTYPLAEVMQYLNISGVDKSLLFLKSRVSKDISLEAGGIKELIEYYKLCRRVPSPLYPEWIKGYFCNDEKLLKLRSSQFFEDDYFTWAFKERTPPSSKLLLAEWHSICSRVFNGFVNMWYPGWKV
jgi:exodeoxyribonuclease V gamma subunit